MVVIKAKVRGRCICNFFKICLWPIMTHSHQIQVQSMTAAVMATMPVTRIRVLLVMIAAKHEMSFSIHCW
jgi:hypothetical protein